MMMSVCSCRNFFPPSYRTRNRGDPSMQNGSGLGRQGKPSVLELVNRDLSRATGMLLVRHMSSMRAAE